MADIFHFPQSVYHETVQNAAMSGRRITAGLSVMNRAGKGAFSRVWLPREITADPLRLAAHEFRAEWVAVHEIDIARQYGNHMIYDMSVDQNAFKWSHYDHARMTDDGYRFVVITVGTYDRAALSEGGWICRTCGHKALREEPACAQCGAARGGGRHAAAGGDELRIFDRELRERVQQIVNILWDIERGKQLSDYFSRQLWFKGWNEKAIFPDIGINLAGLDLAYRAESWHKPAAAKKMNYQLTRKFLDLIATLRQDRFHSDQVMFGIDIPEFDKTHEWIYLADPENKIYEFNNIIYAIYSKFDMSPVCGQYGQQPTVKHLPTYRHRQNLQATAA